MALTPEELKKLQTEANEEVEDYSELPDGKYYGEITDAARGVSNQGYDKVTLEITITEGQYEGRKKWSNYLLEHTNPKVPMIAIKNLDTLAKSFDLIDKGEEISDFNLEDVVGGFVGKEVYFTLETSKGKDGKEYTNIKKMTAC